jgi:trehalose-6-phosphatase
VSDYTYLLTVVGVGGVLAVHYVLDALALGLDGGDVMPLYVGGDVTDVDAFAALAGRGVGIVVGKPTTRGWPGRSRAAGCVVDDLRAVQRFLGVLARGS